MTKRIPDIFLTPKQLEERAKQSMNKAKALPPGRTRDRMLKEAQQDEAMAEMKRMVRDFGPERRTG
jgi:hypothetical protein